MKSLRDVREVDGSLFEERVYLCALEARSGLGCLTLQSHLPLEEE